MCDNRGNEERVSWVNYTPRPRRGFFGVRETTLRKLRRQRAELVVQYQYALTYQPLHKGATTWQCLRKKLRLR
jgi:hypothetical protein